MRRGPSIRRHMVGVTLLTLLMPIGVVVYLRLYHTYLVRETERGLISESVAIGEMWRERWLQALGLSIETPPRIQPPNAPDPQFFPYEPKLNLVSEAPAPRMPTTPAFRAPLPHDAAFEAASSLRFVLQRMRLSNLSGASILDANGCVLVSVNPTIEAGCVDYLPEVKEAVTGRYGSAARLHESSVGVSELKSISRGSGLRVFTAVPIFSDGQVVSIIHLSRTSLSPLKAVWLDRRGILLGLFSSILLVASIALYTARTIARPVREITKASQAVARGEPRQPLQPGGIVPAEVYDLSQALDTMTAQLSDRAAYISEFAANVSHELKTPLTAIRGAAELVREHGNEMTEEERARFLDNITSDVHRMERLVTRLLQLARIQSAPAEAEEVAIRPFFEKLVTRYPQSVRFDVSQAPTKIVIHQDHFESAIRNLIDNAVRHGEGMPVDVVATEENGRLIVRVTDRGPGISEGNRDKIFKRFFTTERDHGGTGLGLSIVEAVARTRGGSVTFETGDGGTTFTLKL